MTKPTKLDDLDIAILRELQKDCRTPLQDIAVKVKKPTSTVHYRVKRLEREGVIDGYYAHINPDKVEMDYLTIIKVMASYGPKYYERIGNELKRISGVWAVYYSLGDQDFFVLTRSRDRAEFMETLDKVMATRGVERTATQVIAKVIMEDPRLQI
jgi:DNA-binding Lrp family transcriptional regulator